MRRLVILLIISCLGLFAMADDSPPTISNVGWTPEHPNEESIIEIYATVTDESGIEEVSLIYCHEENCYPPAQMQGSNGRYSVQIGPFNEGTLKFHINARDTAGNIASTGEYMLFIDGTPPNVKVISPNGGEIFSKKIKIQWLVSDNKDSFPKVEIDYSNNGGISWYSVDEVYGISDYMWNTSSLEDGKDYLIRISATDNAGNSNDDVSDSPFTIDNAPPQTYVELKGNKNKDWFITNVTVSFIATDNISGVKVVRYRVDNGKWQNYTNPFKITTNGIHNITYYSVDKAGNEEDEKFVTFKIDKRVPTVSINKPREGYLYIFGKEVFKTQKTIIFGKINIEVSATDSESGIEKVEFYVNDNLKYVDSEPPYTWLWNERAFFLNTIKVIAYNNAGNFAEDIMDVYIFNL